MQTSETYMIGWRARVHQQCDSALPVTCHAKRGNSGTRRSPVSYRTSHFPPNWNGVLGFRKPEFSNIARWDREHFILAFASLENVDGFGELPGAPGGSSGACARCASLELGIGVLGRRGAWHAHAWPPTGRRACSAPGCGYGSRRGSPCRPARSGPRRPSSPRCSRFGPRSGHERRRATARDHMISPSRLAVTCRFIPCLRCLPE